MSTRGSIAVVADGPEPRARILRAAEELFACKGYSAVGVRELAARAGVNIAMISYYFGSKQGVLEEIVGQFFDRFEQAAAEVFALDLPSEEQWRELVRRLLALFTDQPRLVRIAMTELPLDAVDLARLKAGRIRRFIDCARARADQGPDSGKLAAIIGPAFVAALAAHFLMKPVLEQVGQVDFDEAYYRRLPEVLADLLSGGLLAVAAAERAGRYSAMDV